MMYRSTEAELPNSQAERVAMLEGVMISAATGGSHEDPFYAILRTEFRISGIACPILFDSIGRSPRAGHTSRSNAATMLAGAS